MSRLHRPLAIAFLVALGSEANAQTFYARPLNVVIGAGYTHVPLDPNLPRDLINHENHREDPFLTGSPGSTDLEKVTIGTAEIEAGVAIRPVPMSFAVIAEYVLKFDVNTSGRLEQQQRNDPRAPSLGSFIYSQVSDVALGHALRTGVAGAVRLSEDRDWWLELQGLIDFGKWNMTFEKGWSRHGSDETALRSRASGREVSPRFKVALATHVVALHASVALVRLRFAHDSESLGSHDASGVSFGFGAKLMLPPRPWQ